MPTLLLHVNWSSHSSNIPYGNLYLSTGDDTSSICLQPACGFLHSPFDKNTKNILQQPEHDFNPTTPNPKPAVPWTLSKLEHQTIQRPAALQLPLRAKDNLAENSN
ncbi:hypothetical protein Droror1_Dr00021587 [Drosera rotundifolia]